MIRRLSYLLLTFLLMIPIAGIIGCSCYEETPAERAAREAKEKEEELKRLEEERKKADLLLAPSATLPSSPKGTSIYLKPGHWNSVALPIKAQNIDFDGNISQFLTDKNGQPTTIQNTRFRLTTSRPLIIAKQSSKRAESLVFCPADYNPKRLSAQLNERKGGSIKAFVPKQPTVQMLDHQYHFVVLAKEPRRYAFLDSLHSVTTVLPTNLETSQATKGINTFPISKNYRIVSMPAVPSEIGLGLPDNPIAWTTIAYLLWDEVDPDLLRIEQRDAIIDWLGWGGQIIVNGPDSLDMLRGSFLEPFLPAESTGARKITSKDLAKLNSLWNVSRNAGASPEGEWTGVGLSLLEKSKWLSGMDNLLAERRVGRGRVVVSGFQLAQPQLINWAAGVENFYNAAILRRPPRRFVNDRYTDRQLTLWADKEEFSLDPHLNSQVRLLMRDSLEDFSDLNFGANFESDYGNGTDSSYMNISLPDIRGGVGAWNNYQLGADAARTSLRESAGVSIPGAGFVAFCLLVYLVFLVPVNGFFFHALGKVEWAWVSAPILAILATIVVVRQAQLDIGFVRSQTEIALLETQPDTPRGVLTRFTALYASLTTPYELEFDRGTAVAVPFPAINRGERFENRNNYADQVTFSRQEHSRLRGLVVSSASTEFVRSEEMVNLQDMVAEGSSRRGGIFMGKSPEGEPRLQNYTDWPLESVMVLQRADGVRGKPRLEGCWIGQLEPGTSAIVAMVPLFVDEGKLPFDQERADETTVLRTSEDRPNLQPLLEIALDVERFEPGERRVVAIFNQSVEGLTVKPAASQKRAVTLYVGHLSYGPLAPPKSDKNAPVVVKRTTPMFE